MIEIAIPLAPPDPDSPYVIHAPAADGASALCGRETRADNILAHGPLRYVDCPACTKRLDTEEGARAAIEGAKIATVRLRGGAVTERPVYWTADGHVTADETKADPLRPRSFGTALIWSPT